MMARACLVGPLALCAQAAQAAGRLGGGGALDVSLGRIVGSLVVCVAIAVLAILLLRARYGSGGMRGLAERLASRARQRIVVIETRRLGSHAELSLVSCDGREYLMLLQQGASRIVATRAADEERCA